MTVEIVCAQSEQDIKAVRELFGEYQDWLGADLCFQGFDDELRSLPGKYGRPEGVLLLAKDGEKIVGCVGVRPLAEEKLCEMKRLWVRQPWRGTGVGRRLAVGSIEAAQNLGYQTMKLDTLERLAEAVSLYRALSFTETDAYYDNPLERVIYMSLAL